MRGLAGGMNPGIGPPGALDEDRDPGQARAGSLEHLLHRQPIGLALPATQTGAVIFERKLVARHSGVLPSLALQTYSPNKYPQL